MACEVCLRSEEYDELSRRVAHAETMYGKRAKQLGMSALARHDAPDVRATIAEDMVEITRLQQTESALRDLSGRAEAINCSEKDRAIMDLCPRLALVGFGLDSIRRTAPEVDDAIGTVDPGSDATE